MNNYDIAIIGGGAAGLAAAISAKRENGGLSAAVLERLPRVGKKILSTGNGRCNLANKNITRDKYFGSCGELYTLCGQYGYEEFFSSLGVLTVSDECGRVYPSSGAASSVLDALRLEAAALGAECICDFAADGIDNTDNGFVIRSGDKKLRAKAVIIAGGGKSQSSLGSDGSMLKICKNMGIGIREPFPALVPLKTDAELIRPLKGQRVPAKVTAYIDGEKTAAERGEVQFGDGVLSGICIFDLSCLKGIQTAGVSEISLDLLPDIDEKAVTELFFDIRERRAGASLEDYLSGVFNKRIGIYIIRQCTKKTLAEKVSSLSDREVSEIACKAKDLVFPVKGAAGFERSQVTGGGVAGGEIDENLRSKKINGLYFCGEILDIHGKCGGYNLAFAFASGQHAGKMAAKEVKRLK